MVNLLIEHGADLNLKNHDDMTALMAAACGSDGCKTYTATHRQAALALIGAGAGVEGQSRSFGMTALTKAAFHGDLELARALLDRGAEVNRKESNGKSALWIAAEWGHTGVVALLAEHGADLSAIPKAPNDVSALYVASELGALGIVRTLLAHSADASWSDHRGNTPLMMAALHGHTEIVRLLTEAGTDVNARNHDGMAALHFAAAQGLDGMVKLLLAHGADPTIRCNEYRETPPAPCDSESAEMLAARLGHPETAEMLKATQKSAEQP